MYQRPKNTWAIILTVLLVLILAAGSYLTYKYYNDWKNEKDAKVAIEKELATCKSSLSASQKASSSTETATTESTCTSTLSTADKTGISDWKTYTNEPQKYSFKYPKTFTVSSEEADLVTLKDNTDGADINFSFRSDKMAATDIDTSYTKGETKTLKVACATATEVFFSNDTQKLISVTFEKNTPQLIIFTYKDVGASISGDILDAFALMLKTIEFK